MAIIRRYLNTSFTYGGTGADGALHLDGSATIAHCTKVGSTYTATASINASSILIDVGVTFLPGNFNHFCTGDFTNNGLVDASGFDGSQGGAYPIPTGGNAGADGRGTLAGNLPALTTRTGQAKGGDGGNYESGGPAVAGTAGNAGGGGGRGGDADPNGAHPGAIGGSGGSPVRFTSPTDISDFVTKLFSTPSALSTLGVSTTDAGGGGGGGGGGATNGVSGSGQGGAGGGRAGNGEWIGLFANRFLGTGTFRSKGGTGGAGRNGHVGTEIGGSAGGGGGGAPGDGGSGGLLALVASQMPRVLTDVSGGAAGAVGIGGTGAGPFGKKGDDASAGTAGIDGLAILVSTGARPRKQIAFLLGLGATNVPIPPPVPAPDDCVEDPLIMVRWSNDGGHSYGTELSQSIGRAGEYNKRVTFKRLGRSRDRVYEVKVTDAVKVRFISAFLDIDEGTN